MKVLTIFGVILIFLAAVLPSLFLQGLILQDVWNWFVSPILEIKSLPYLNAIAIVSVLNMFASIHATGRAKEEKEGVKDAVTTLATVYGTELATLGILYLLH